MRAWTFFYNYRTGFVGLACLLLIFSLYQPGQARDGINPKTGWPDPMFLSSPQSLVSPRVDHTAHRRGNIQLTIGNNGTFGTLGRTLPDPFTGEAMASCTYPVASDLIYLWVASVWIGAVVGRDTLVSVGDEDFYVTREFWPDIPPFGNFQYLSIDPNSPFYSPEAYSEEDILCEYTDTLKDLDYVQPDFFDNRVHIPLNVKIKQRSMAWSYDYADDFILFDYRVQNIGVKTLKDVYLGIWVDGDVWHTSRNSPEGWDDDLVGFYRTHPAPEGYGLVDTVNIAYHADNDGDPEGGGWDYRSTPHVVGTRIVRTPSDSLAYSFNWWTTNYSNDSRDFGPRLAHSEEDPFRSFGSRLGTPEGDKNKYYIMRHDEFDYDLLYTALDHSRDTLKPWRPPPEDAEEYASGWDCRYLLSFGPFKIHPGQQLPISFAWVGGMNLHSDPVNFEALFDPHNPSAFYSSLDFSNLAANSRWASWVYDNPGVDSDSDGYYGKTWIICSDTSFAVVDTNIGGVDTSIYMMVLDNCDTIFYEGDGVPDFRGAGPPPAPDFMIHPETGSLRIRFNGQRSETTKDVFSHLIDFEGYRIYVAFDDRPESFFVVTSYDKEDYNKFVFENGEYVLKDIPFALGELRCLYGDSCGDTGFHPLDYSHSRPYQHPDFPESTFIFEPQDFNASTFTGDDRTIYKVYPDQPYPSQLNPEFANPDELTEEGRLKYFEYEYIHSDLLPTIEYYVNVTAFDFGSPKSGLASLETSISFNAQAAYPLPSAGEIAEKELDAYVYPNPYRINADYSTRGFENRDNVMATERARLLHFANLPARCTINIYSLDGDLIRQLDHDKDENDPTASHETWDIITRNTQAVVTGLYYFVIESDTRTQIGKFVIIK